MSLLPEIELEENFLPFVQFREKFGFVPNIFRAQTLLPRAIEAEAHIAATVVLREAGLSRVQKERLLHSRYHDAGRPGRCQESEGQKPSN